MKMHTTQPDAQNRARKRGLLSQKDLMDRWDATVRTIQRHRLQFGLEPVDFYGNNPLFRLEDVEALEEKRRQHGMERFKRQQKNGKQSQIITLHEERKAAQILSLKEIRKLARKQHQKGLSPK